MDEAGGASFLLAMMPPSADAADAADSYEAHGATDSLLSWLAEVMPPLSLTASAAAQPAAAHVVAAATRPSRLTAGPAAGPASAPSAVLGADLARDYELRRRVYENRDAFYEVAADAAAAAAEAAAGGASGSRVGAGAAEDWEGEEDEELSAIQKYTAAGRERLVAALGAERDAADAIERVDGCVQEMRLAVSDAVQAGRKMQAALESLEQAIGSEAAAQLRAELGDQACGKPCEVIAAHAHAMLTASGDAAERWQAAHAASVRRNRKCLRRLAQLYGVLSDANIGYTCPICMNHPVELFLECGHTMCSTCPVPRKCYVCRAAAGRPKRLYFTGPF